MYNGGRLAKNDKIIIMEFDYTIIIYIIFGILPSLVWLFYYLRKDFTRTQKNDFKNIFVGA